DPPVITITRPAAGETVQGAFPAAVSTTVEGTIAEAALRSVTVSVNGHTAFPVYYVLEAPGSYRFLATINGPDGLASGSNEITIHATDFANSMAPAMRQFTYVIPPRPMMPTADILPAGI